MRRSSVILTVVLSLMNQVMMTHAQDGQFDTPIGEILLDDRSSVGQDTSAPIPPSTGTNPVAAETAPSESVRHSPSSDLDEATRTYITKLNEEVEGNPEMYPLPPVVTNVVRRGSLFEMNFIRSPVTEVLKLYSDISGVQVVVDNGLSAEISYVSNRKWTYHGHTSNYPKTP